MRLALKEKYIKRARANIRGSQITHLLYVVNCVLFGEAIKELIALKQILQEYEVCSN